MSDEEQAMQMTLDDGSNNSNTVATSSDVFSLSPVHAQTPKPTKIDVQEFSDAASARAWIFSTNDLLEEIVYVPEWKMNVLLVGLTAAQRNAVIKTSTDSNGQPDIDKLYADLVIKSARHPKTREPLFQLADRTALNARSGKVIDQLATVISRLSGLTSDAQEQATKN